MSETFRCDDKERLVEYLYGELDADGRREVERHLRSCPACALETNGLQAVRQDLRAWQPPDAELGFAIVARGAQTPATVLRPSRWAALGKMPAWARVAAAVLVLGISAGIANVQVRYGNEGLVVTTGWMSPAPQASTPAPVTAAPSEDWRPALAALERSLSSRLAQVTESAARPVASRESVATVDTQGILRRVQALLDESERRQREEMALRLTQTHRDWDMQRRGDMLRIEQRLGTLQGRTFKTEAGQTEVLNYLRRVSAQQVP